MIDFMDIKYSFFTSIKMDEEKLRRRYTKKIYEQNIKKPAEKKYRLSPDTDRRGQRALSSPLPCFKGNLQRLIMEYGLIGEHLPHSFSKIIHEKLAPYSYELHELRPDEVDSFMRGKEFKGINVLLSPL